MYASSSSVNPTPLAHADNQRDVHPRGNITIPRFSIISCFRMEELCFYMLQKNDERMYVLYVVTFVVNPSETDEARQDPLDS
ncbi:hypothetical protein TNCV_1951651 [Trichonephila clavipes]|nr:hypothetical protein TNCV_1951651 [Trichonephila clavipes]